MEDFSDKLSKELFQAKRRKKLLPWWIKFFAWIFIVLGPISLISLPFAVLGFDFELSLYGFETNKPISIIGIVIITLFAFKGLTAYSLLKEKDWAITYGIVDATIGILACILSMFFPLSNQNDISNFTFRLELLLLIPYLIYMGKTKSEWENSIDQV